MSKEKKTLPDRKALVLAVSDMNKTLGLDPKIKTKDEGNFVPETVIIENLKKYAKGYDDETGKYDKGQAISRSDTEQRLQDSTYDVLEAIGAIEPSAKKTVKKATFEDRKADKKVATPKAKKVGGRLPQDFKTMRKQLEDSNESMTLARSFDKLLLKKQTLAEHMKEADAIQKKLGVTRSLVAHIKWRMENSGWVFKDTRKFQHDENGTVYCFDLDPSRCGKFKCELPVRAKTAKAEKPAKTSDKPSKKGKEEKVDKKADKKAVKKGDKKSK